MEGDPENGLEGVAAGGSVEKDQRRLRSWAEIVSAGDLVDQHNNDKNSNSSKNEAEEESKYKWETVKKKHPRKLPQVSKEYHLNKFKRPARELKFQMKPSHNEQNHDLRQPCKKLWELDVNRLTPGKDYKVNCGDGKRSYHKPYMAAGRLFTWLRKDVLEKPTFSRFYYLLKSYDIPREGYKEQATSQEIEEFIEEICKTAPIKYLHKYLNSKSSVSLNNHDFKRLLTSLWFDLYGRGGASSNSSAFKHVFVGEIKDRAKQEVSGFHNWLQFYMEEANGNVAYQGYIFPLTHRETWERDSKSQLLTIQFEWKGVPKLYSSMMIGVSPEFEIALYTLCFYMGREDNYVNIGPHYVNIKCYRHGIKLGSAFPIEVPRFG